MQEDIDLFILLASSRIKAFPPIGKRNSVQWWGGWVSTCLYVNHVPHTNCIYV